MRVKCLIYARIQCYPNRVPPSLRRRADPEPAAPSPSLQPPLHYLPASAHLARLHRPPCLWLWAQRPYVSCFEPVLPLPLSKRPTVLYGFSLAYLVAPATFDSAHIIEFVGGLPDAVKYAGKAILAAPFAFHSLNGLRHLGWDLNKCESHSYTLCPS